MKLSVNTSSTKTVSDILNSAFQRLCVDLRNMKVVGKFDFYKVPPSDRLWIWERDFNTGPKKAQIKKLLGVKE
ncbi:MAG: hypothetical protein ACT4OJ_13400 [Bacteroidota bacterium]